MQVTATITHFHLGHTTLGAHLYCLCLSSDPFCPCTTTPETIKHFLLHCPHFHSHHTALRSRLSVLAITTLHLPTLIAVSGVHPSRQPAVLHPTSAFLRKSSQLLRL
ncbi:hypothetical protein E2C01_079302 [Portunus trituberculatus]|uniref:Reverse transcriptase zinc-binding domain-containing protein n=1 Tax=Portunus trituberculatus TaxID=210409 RepID=A0A5B7IL64_PORTR|nr:hypothetical protein [Portunus trituberculatus]